MLSERITSGSESVAVVSGPASMKNKGRRGKGTPSPNGDSKSPHPQHHSPLPTHHSPQEGRGETQAPPSPNGNSRAANGRFAPGNEGGPGNPFARQVAALRKRLLDAATPELFDEVFQVLVKKMRDGDIQAIKLFLAYTIGKPAKAPEPDLLAEEELERFQGQSQVWAQFARLVSKPGPELPLEILREARPTATKAHLGMIGNFLEMPDNKAGDLLDELRMMPRDIANRKLTERLSKKKSVVRSQ